MSNKRTETKYIVIHSSLTTPLEKLTSRDIDAKHRKEGLLSCGYHKIITREGKIEDGRDITISGLHIEPKDDINNANSIGICLIGGKSTNGEPDCNFTFKQYEALIRLVKELKSKYKQSLVIGHRDVADTPCPNFSIQELLG